MFSASALAVVFVSFQAGAFGADSYIAFDARNSYNYPDYGVRPNSHIRKGWHRMTSGNNDTGRVYTQAASSPSDTYTRDSKIHVGRDWFNGIHHEYGWEYF